MIPYVLCFFAISGCAWFQKNPPTEDQPKYVDAGKILDKGRFQKGGKLLIVPFKAWAGVEANDELDKIALLMVQGVSEVLMTEEAPFEILTAANADTAELVLKGYITKKWEEGGVKKTLLFQSKTKYLAVRGELIDKKTNKVIAHFSKEKVSDDKNLNYKTLAKELGEDVGRFLNSSLQ